MVLYNHEKNKRENMKQISGCLIHRFKHRFVICRHYVFAIYIVSANIFRPRFLPTEAILDSNKQVYHGTYRQMSRRVALENFPTSTYIEAD